MKYAFAGDRQISCNILNILVEKGYTPSALLVTDREDRSHTNELIRLSGLGPESIFYGGKAASDEDTLAKLRDLELDYIIGIHYPYIITKKLLELPKIGFLNLHPAYLPYNKGWHTPSWAILDKTPYGATLHFMTQELDTGDIIHQKQIEILPHDTADSLYHRVLELEEEVFTEALDQLISLKPNRFSQISPGTSHKSNDLDSVRQITDESGATAAEFLDKLRALTTNRQEELAYFTHRGRKIGVRIEFVDLGAE